MEQLNLGIPAKLPHNSKGCKVESSHGHIQISVMCEFVNNIYLSCYFFNALISHVYL